MTGRHDAAKMLGAVHRRRCRRAATSVAWRCCCTTPGRSTRSRRRCSRWCAAASPTCRSTSRCSTTARDARPTRFLGALPFAVHAAAATRCRRRRALRDALPSGRFDYVMLFESSGMYSGEDVAVAGLPSDARPARRRLGQPAAVGARHPGVVPAALPPNALARRHQLRRQPSAEPGCTCVLYGRYISDTLSAVRAVRAADALRHPASPLTHKRANQHLLARLLRRKAEMLEIPVQFFPISPEQVKRTSASTDCSALGAISVARRSGVTRRRRVASRRTLPMRDERRRAHLAVTRRRSCLVVPAAGRGSRLGSGARRRSSPVDGRPDARPALATCTAPCVERIVVVAHPASCARRSSACAREPPCGRRSSMQPQPTGMLDAILLAHAAVADGTARRASGSPGAIRSPSTRRPSQRLATPTARFRPALVLPTVGARHAVHPLRARRARAGSSASCSGAKATRCRTNGESDMGLFGLSARPIFERLPRFTRDASRPAAATGERNSCRSFRGWRARATSDVRRDTTHGGGRRSTRPRNCTQSRRSCGRVPEPDADAVDRHPRLQRGALHRHAARADQGRRSRAARRRQGDHRRRRLLDAIGRPRSSRGYAGVHAASNAGERRQGRARCAPASSSRPATT